MVNGQPAVLGLDRGGVDAQFTRLPIVLGARLGGPVQKQDLLCVFVVPGRRIKYG